jgi:hypothetical protein
MLLLPSTHKFLALHILCGKTPESAGEKQLPGKIAGALKKQAHLFTKAGKLVIKLSAVCGCFFS